MMKVEYKFEEFQKKYKDYKIDNMVKLPQLRFYETHEEMVMTFRDREDVDIYTVIKIQDIIDFGLTYGASVDESISDFNINYLSAAERIYNDPRYDNVSSLNLSSNKSYSKKVIDDPGKDVVDESKDYAEFMSNMIKSWERKVITAIDKIDKDYSKKTFGEFLSQMMNTINSISFMGKLKKYIKASVIEGIEGAEQEIGVQVGFSFESGEKVKALEHQQLNGYTLPDGKQWYGIKGATKEMQFDILKTVEEGVRNKKSNKEIKSDVKNIFDTASKTQTERITRTETTRFINEGRLTAYKESGVEGFKVWSAINDNKTSDICRRLHGTKVGFDEPFLDKKTGIAFHYPPGHVNCRCIIEFDRK